MFTLYGIAFAQARKPYRKAALFTHKNGDFPGRRDFFNGAKLRRDDLQNGESHIG